jgi:hypothetical protein
VIIPVAAIVALLVPVLVGGDPRRLATIPVRHVGWILGALAAQILVIEILSGPAWALELSHVVTYLAAAAFVAVNLRLPGLWVIGLGAGLNGVTIALNGGTLPARPGALRSAGIETADGFVNSGAVADPHLAFLGDVFAVPASLPLSNVFSVGDVLIIAGTAYAAWRVMGSRWTTPWQAGQAPVPSPGAGSRRRLRATRAAAASAPHAATGSAASGASR